VYKSGQSVFQMGDNSNLFDFVTVKNVVHAHLLGLERKSRVMSVIGSTPTERRAVNLPNDAADP
jgi:nucleoside-diphosphate-sugar epimerase